MRTILGVVGIAFLFGVTWWTTDYIARAELPSGMTDIEPSVVQFLGLAALMLIGILSSHLFDRAKKAGNEPFHLVEALRELLSNGGVICSLIVAPIIFNAIYLALKDKPFDLSSYFLAYQNGFFWRTVLSAVAPGAASPRNPN